MEKKIFTLFLSLFLFFISSKAHSQNVMVIYDYQYKTDSLSPIYEEEPMFLFVNNKKSVFASYVRFKTDSLYQIDKKTDFSKGDIRWKINKDYSTNEITESQIIGDNLYSFEDQYKLDWELINETKTSSGFTLHKAKTSFRGRVWEAWYCSEIPFTDGPYKFHGLPGLIFEISDARKYYVFSLIKMYKSDFNPLTIQSSMFVDRQHKVSKKEYLKMRKIETDDPARSFKADLSDGKIILAPGRTPEEMIKGIEKMAKEKQAKNNNPIELK